MTKYAKIDKEDCKLCQGLERWKAGLLTTFIYEFKNSILVLGDHQFFEGYSMLVSKTHSREIHLLPQPVQAGFFSELMIATRVIHKTFKAWKMNHASYGNQDPHVHVHIIPRYESDPNRHKQPWHESERFEDYLLLPGEGSETIHKIRLGLQAELSNTSEGPSI